MDEARDDLLKAAQELGKLLEKEQGTEDEANPDDYVRDLYTDLNERELRNVVVILHKVATVEFLHGIEDEMRQMPKFLASMIFHQMSSGLAQLVIEEAREPGSITNTQ